MTTQLGENSVAKLSRDKVVFFKLSQTIASFEKKEAVFATLYENWAMHTCMPGWGDDCQLRKNKLFTVNE